MERKARIGVFGCSRGQDYIKILKLLDDVELTAICEAKEPRLERALALCPEYTKGYTDFDEFIKSGLDGVILSNFFHRHTPYAIKAMENGVAVMSETTAAATMGDCVKLVRAVKKYNGRYMLAENYPFFATNMEIKRIYDEGSLGRVLYAEGEYVHPMSKEQMIDCSHPTHWRTWAPKTYYLTHSLGPLMYITSEMPKTVNARSIFAPDLFEGTFRRSVDAASVMLVKTGSGAIFTFTGTATYAPHGNWYRVSGTKGGAETVRGDENSIRVGYNDWDRPENAKDGTYRVDWTNENKQIVECAGHGGGDYWVCRKFIDYILHGEKPFFDVYRSVAMSAVAIQAWRSSLNNGVEYKIPDFTCEEDLAHFENDFDSPFPDDEHCVLPPASQPYTPDVLEKL